MLQPLHQPSPPLSNSSFENAITQLRVNMVNQHAAREARELAQHADQEAREDCCNAQQTFKDQFGITKTKEVMRLLNMASEDDLPETLRALGCNKKKSDDIHVLLGAIDEQASSLASTANEDTKPQLSTHIINKFRNFTWAATGNNISDGITPFNITFVSETAARALAAKVDSLSMVEAGGSAMSYTDAQVFLKNDANFPPDTSSCAYRLAVHSMLVDIMMGPTNPFAVAYQNCVQDLQSHLLLGL